MDENYWTHRWNTGQTGWDMGHASPAICAFAEERIPEDACILIPGAGNAYEGEWLYQHGWKKVHILDIAAPALDRIRRNRPDFPSDQLIHGDFFQHEGEYDFVLEQTFFCALNPQLRDDYVAHMARLIPKGGMLAGLLFDFPLTEQGPPFGGSRDEYESRFSTHFTVEELAITYLSIKPRAGKEFWFEARRK